MSAFGSFGTTFGLGAMLMAAGAGCSSPTAPDARQGVLKLTVSCGGDGTVPLECRAVTSCAANCSGPLVNGPVDVSGQVQWLVQGTAVRHVGSGRFASVEQGDATISASLPAGYPGDAPPVPVGVFGTRHAVPTTTIAGRVGAGTVRDTPFGPQPVWERMLNGARVEIVDGLVAGRSYVTGERPIAPPGILFFFPRFGEGEFQFFGIPAPATYVLEIRAAGLPEARRTVSLPFWFSAPFVDVVLP